MDGNRHQNDFNVPGANSNRPAMRQQGKKNSKALKLFNYLSKSKVDEVPDKDDQDGAHASVPLTARRGGTSTKEMNLADYAGGVTQREAKPMKPRPPAQ